MYYNLRFYFFGFLIFVTTFFSCTSNNKLNNGLFIQKRKHLNGWNVTVNYLKLSKSSLIDSVLTNKQNSNYQISSLNLNVLKTDDTLNQIINENLIDNNIKCDTIITKDGLMIFGLIQQKTNDSIIEYIICESENNKVLSKKINEIKRITYSNGQSINFEEFKTEKKSKEKKINEINIDDVLKFIAAFLIFPGIASFLFELLHEEEISFIIKILALLICTVPFILAFFYFRKYFKDLYKNIFNRTMGWLYIILGIILIAMYILYRYFYDYFI